MIEVTQLKAGTAFEENGAPFLVLKYTHTKLGRGKANIKVKVRNLKSGAVLQKSFVSGAKVKPIELKRKMMQYLYSDEENFYLMDKRTFEQVEVERGLAGEGAKFLKEGIEVEVLFWEEKALSIQMPNFVELEVVDTGPTVKGNSATNIYKDAVLAGDVRIRVPLFIKGGDKVKIDTRDESYVERVKKLGKQEGEADEDGEELS